MSRFVHGVSGAGTQSRVGVALRQPGVITEELAVSKWCKKSSTLFQRVTDEGAGYNLSGITDDARFHSEG